MQLFENDVKKYTLPYTFNIFQLMKKNYSIGFYTGGIDIENLRVLTDDQVQKALAKDWYLRWSFRHPETGKLTRQRNFKGGVNRLKTVKERISFLKEHKKRLEELLNDGLSPYGSKDAFTFDVNTKKYTIKDALEEAYNLASLNITETTAKDYKYAKDEFLRFIGKENEYRDISEVNKKVILAYLNDKMKKTSARTRNNRKSSLSALFNQLENNEIIDRNFIKEIPKEKTREKTDRTLSRDQLTNIVEYLKKNDPTLLLYLKFVAYNFLRPIEVNRLKVKDVDLKEGFLYFRAKNKPLKKKIIPSVYIDDLRKLELENYDPEDYLFTLKDSPGEWIATDNNRRDRYSKRFKKVKDKFNLGNDYGLYSFRHSFITNLFQHLRTKKGMSYNEAIDTLMPITGHTSKEGLMNYIHKIDADIPKDYSGMIDVVL